MPLDQVAISLALHEIAAHPAVVDPGKLVVKGDSAYFSFGLELGFGSRWVAEGASPTGVFAIETVRLDFSGGFPSVAAQPSLRPDFSRDHPHIQPWLGPDGRVVPCLVDGSLDEFVAAYGYYPLIDQFVGWLRAAAEERLIDPAQGWEPMRRDECNDALTCDLAQMRSMADGSVGSQLFRTRYALLREAPEDLGSYLGEVVEPTVSDLTTVERRLNDAGTTWGEGLTLAIWAPRAKGKTCPVSSKYTPDTIADLEGLKCLATDLGLRDAFENAFCGLRLRVPRWQTLVKARARPTTLVVPIIFMVRRPVALIGSDSDVELCGYCVSLSMTDGWDNAPVRALAVWDAISASLLQRMSGAPEAEPWMLLGCGSIGSKIALHRTRAGFPPTVCVDHAVLKPHNVARHALYPEPSVMQLGWTGAKADHLAKVISRFNLKSEARRSSHADLIERLAQGEKAPPWLVNTTASTVAREDLAYATPKGMPRIVEACLFDRGGLGYFSVEGDLRNPDTAELIGELYRLASRDERVGSRLFNPKGDVGRVSIGQGCSSVTIVLSDARIDLMASSFSELIGGLDSADRSGRIDIFTRDEIDLRHTRLVVPPCSRVPLDGLDGWTTSVSHAAFGAVQLDIGNYPTVETGGVLIGWVSRLARRIYVVDVLPAPADSVRSAREFVLGTDGLAEQLYALSDRTAGALVCVGTWHSHLGSATPSVRDRLSAALVGAAYLRPMAFLIHGSDGLRALSAAAGIDPHNKGATSNTDESEE